MFADAATIMREEAAALARLGCTKTSEIEPADLLVARINEAARYVDLERLGLSTQCGFSTPATNGPPTSER